MPRLANSNIAHMVSTDHRILRRAEDGRRQQADPGRTPEYPLLHFHQGLVDANDPGVARDLGIALMDLAGLKQPEPRRVRQAEQALPLLEAAVRATPGDAAAGQARGYALWLLGRRDEALAAFRAALEQAPGREEALAYAAACAAQLGRPDEAAAYWRRALDVNPWAVRPHYELARLLARRREWREGSEQCQAALRLDPFHLEARLLLVRCSLRLGDRDRARTELDRLAGLNPQQEIALRRWFAEELQTADGTPK
jgi:tetratricopeptide (TPR) repeat protein